MVQGWMSANFITSVSSFQIFCNNGEFKNRFGVRGRSPGQLQRPTGVAVHPSGDIIIADYDNKWVSIFSCEGKFKVRLPLIQCQYRIIRFVYLKKLILHVTESMFFPFLGETWLWEAHGAKGRNCGSEWSCDRS